MSHQACLHLESSLADNQAAAENADQAWQFALQAALLQHTNDAAMTQYKDQNASSGSLHVEGQAPWSLMPAPVMRPDLGQLGLVSLHEYAVGS